jgi:SAM-dependent methyltransferase
MTKLENYPLGYSEAEAKRLMEQGAMLEDLTADLLSRAGLAPGMRVLDVGCGVGDVSLLAARIVGKKALCWASIARPHRLKSQEAAPSAALSFAKPRTSGLSRPTLTHSSHLGISTRSLADSFSITCPGE